MSEPGQRHPNVVRSSEVPPVESANGDFVFTARRLGAAAKGGTLGVSLMEVPPGKTAFPYHFHSGIEEGFYVLEGEGRLRIGADTVDVRAGDYVATPVGPDLAHQLTNTGAGPLRYLALSAPAVHVGMDVCVYPDSNKVAFYAGVQPGKSWRDGASIRKLVSRDTPDAGYFDGEPLAKK